MSNYCLTCGDEVSPHDMEHLSWCDGNTARIDWSHVLVSTESVQLVGSVTGNSLADCLKYAVEAATAYFGTPRVRVTPDEQELLYSNRLSDGTVVGHVFNMSFTAWKE